MISDPAFDSMLQLAASKIAMGHIADAYTQFDVHQCGPSYATKFFYFLGLGAAANPLPLILDRRVAQSLRVLIGDDVDCFTRGWRRIHPLYRSDEWVGA